MDEDLTFQQPCAQCSAVNWGISDEDRFFCKSCHNVIERTREVQALTFDPSSSRVSTLGRGRSHRRTGSGRRWRICEAFQFILRIQADALLRLGVSAHFKDQVLCPMWRRFLQKSGQAFTDRPGPAPSQNRRPSDSESVFGSESDLPCSSASNAGSCSDWSQWSGSEDASSFLSPSRRRGRGPMTMTRTLALIHLALTWARQNLTLCDLIRLVQADVVPFVRALEGLPEDMRLEGTDLLIFRVQTVPSRRAVLHQAHQLLRLLQLPAFPPITRRLLLHPALLSLRYLREANLPDELHPWVCQLLDVSVGAGQLTFDPSSCPSLPQYDLLTAALIIVTMKIVFRLDDITERDLSSGAGHHDDAGRSSFHLLTWLQVTQAALSRARQEDTHLRARTQWTSKKPLCPRPDRKSVVMKKKRTAEQLQICFEKLSSRPVNLRLRPPRAFRFCWGGGARVEGGGATAEGGGATAEGGGARVDGPSLHQQSLARALTRTNTRYWTCSLTRCQPRKCSSHFGAVEPTLPRAFVRTLDLFSFMLDLDPAHLHEEVLQLERLVLARRTHRDPRTHQDQDRDQEQEQGSDQDRDQEQDQDQEQVSDQDRDQEQASD